MKDLWVISLGGSRIIPKEVDEKFIRDFKKLLNSYPEKKFVIVTGGGSTARNYIKAMKRLGKSINQQSKIGISITRFHAEFLAIIFGEKANSPKKLPKNMRKVKSLLRKNQIVFCGGLRWETGKTSDGTAAEIAGYLRCSFINITNVEGLYTSNPKKNRNAKKIPRITWEEFNKMTQKIKFEPGQNFVLDQDAAETIMENKTSTYILKDLADVSKVLNGKEDFKGTLIEG
jgi:uridylate kinase